MHLIWAKELTGEDDSILGGGTPGLDEVDSVATAQRGVTGKDNTRRLVDSPKLSVDIGELFETTALDEL